MHGQENWVLCRVFHKSKGSENSPQNVLDSVTDQTMITSFSQTPPHQNQNPNDSTIQNPSLLSPNLLQLSRDIINDASIDEVNSSCDDEYAFLFDLGFEESCLGDGVPQNFEEMICDDDDDDDGSLVFL